MFCNIRSKLKSEGVLESYYSHFNIYDKISLCDFIKLLNQMAKIPVEEIGVIGNLLKDMILN